MPNRVVIGGTSNCGKSTLAASLYEQLKGNGESVGLYELDTFSDTLPCILGEKPWSERKKRPWGNWNDPMIEERQAEFAADTHNLVIGDLPGVLDGLQERLVRHATAAIAVGKDAETLREWEDFFARMGIPVVIRVISYLGDTPAIPVDDGVILVGNLCREVHLNGEVSRVADRLESFVRAPSLLGSVLKAAS